MSALRNIVKRVTLYGLHRTSKVTIEQATTELTELEADSKLLKEYKVAGSLMSNVFFNWSQQERFTPDERKLMKDLYQRWDSARTKTMEDK
jgi:hypothetical protein